MPDSVSRGRWKKYDRGLHEPIEDRLRESLGERTQKWLAEQTGVPESTLSGQMGKPLFTLEVLRACAKTLGVELAWLVAGDGPTYARGSVPSGRVVQQVEEGEELEKKLPPQEEGSSPQEGQQP